MSTASTAPPSHNLINRLLSGPLADLILRPWYDPLALFGVVRAYMPVSRAWAAATAAEGDPQRFLQALGQPRSLGPGLARAIAETRRRGEIHARAEAEWRDAAFGGGGADLAALEERRLACADAWMRERGAFLPAHVLRGFEPVKYDIESNADVQAHHGARLANLSIAFAGADDTTGIAASRACRLHGRNVSWLRAPAGPRGGEGPAWARVEHGDEPPKGAIVFCHGIMMEREHWTSLYDQSEVFLASEGGAPEGGSLAVISPEGPGHGRRKLPGLYGGEQILARGLGGILDYFAAHVVEVGRLIAWARAKFGGPVAVGGVSLGALTAQLVVSAARHWPAAARPDAAFLLTTNESMIDVVFRGSLAGGLNFPRALTAAGWTEADVQRWRPLVEPGGSALPPERIVCVLGTTDTVTPIAGGERLAARWSIPPANVFRWHGGHFAAAFSVLRDRAPVRRLKAAMENS
ncbi:MAG: hypothetical protein SFV19_16900 [Rhodospirillaceae bacterium]|nr:hypothetical protein [Rhodospirillaceae bacterium]